MNELQQVLLVFAVVVIAGLYFLSRRRQVATKEKAESQPTSSRSQVAQDSKSSTSESSNSTVSQQQASKALNELGEAHIPVSKVTQDRFTRADELEINDNSNADVNHNQVSFSFGDDFDLPEAPSQLATENSFEKVNEQEITPITATIDEVTMEHHIYVDETVAGINEKGGKHHVLVVEDPGMNLEDDHFVPPDREKPSFGVPKEELGKSPGIASGEKQDYEIFVILVMSTGQEFSMVQLNHALLGVGLNFSGQAIYVKKDNMGNEIIKVANLLEPGIFPSDDLESYATPGVAMILELPSTVRAPAAMHDLIMMARKVSQRLEGRLYNMERQLLKESDLQSMRDAAVEYESEPL